MRLWKQVAEMSFLHRRFSLRDRVRSSIIQERLSRSVDQISRLIRSRLMDAWMADIGKIYQWLEKTGVKDSTETLIMAAQEQPVQRLKQGSTSQQGVRCWQAKDLIWEAGTITEAYHHSHWTGVTLITCFQNATFIVGKKNGKGLHECAYTGAPWGFLLFVRCVNSAG